MELDRALEKGFQKFGRGKVCFLGEGRAGKPATANSLLGLEYKETASTVGINSISCDVKYATALGSDNHLWTIAEGVKSELMEAIVNSVLSMRIEKSTQIKDDNKNITSCSSTPSSAVKKIESIASIPMATKTKKTPSTPKPVKKIDEFESEAIFSKLGNLNTPNMKIALFDYGGQDVFSAIHHLFLTKQALYLVVFNMETLIPQVDPSTKEKSLSSIKSWIDSIIMHTTHRIESLHGGIEMAQIILVGTHKDKVSSVNDHIAISILLNEAFGSSVAWPYVIKNVNGEGPSGRAILNFFAINNRIGNNDPSISHLMKTIESSVKASAYFNFEVPLSWSSILDDMNKSKNSHLSLEQVVTIASLNGVVSSSDIENILHFFIEMGAVMWYDEPNLRDIVILDPISFFVSPSTKIICKHIATLDDPTFHESELHVRCMRSFQDDWLAMTKRGIVTQRLLNMLLDDYSDDREHIILLMIKHNLIIPISSSADPSQTE